MGRAPAAEVFPIATNPATVEFAGGVAFDGTNYLVGLVSGSDVVCQRVSSSGELLGPQILVGSNPGFPPAVAMAAASTNGLVVWSDYSLSSGVTLRGQLLSLSGTKIGSPFGGLANPGSYGFQVVQAAASDGTSFLFVWENTSDSKFYGQLVDASGNLSGSEFDLFPSTTVSGNIKLVYGTNNYLLTWASGSNNNNQYYCRTISPSGVLGPPHQVNQTSSLDTNPMAVGFDGTNFLVVWNCDTQRTANGQPLWTLRGRVVSAAGSPLGNELTLVDEQAAFPALAFDGENYLLAWGYNADTTNSDITIHGRFLDRAGAVLGPIFTPFSTQGTNPPLLPLNGLLYDGRRYLLAATFGNFEMDSSGDITGFSGGDVNGAFIPSSTMPPVFTSTLVSNGQFQGQLRVVPGMSYTVEFSTDLHAWTPGGVVSSSGTDSLDLLDPRPIESKMFYRTAIGNLMPSAFSFNFHEYANAGRFGSGLTPTISYPVTLNSYSANFDVENDSGGLPLASNVYFTGPVGCGLTNEPADPNNSFIDFASATYQSPFVSSPSAAPGGTWVVNYRGTDQTFSIADPLASSRLTIPLPTVSVSGDVLQSVSWSYMDASTGSTLGVAPAYVTNIQVQIEGLVDGRIYNSPLLAPNITSHALSPTVNWSDVSMMHMAYDDSLGNHYVVSFTKS